MQRLTRKVQEAQQRYHRLIIVVNFQDRDLLLGLSNTEAWPLLNVGLRTSEALQELSKRERASQAAGIIQKLIRDCGNEIVILDHIEFLFCPELQLDPMFLFRSLSRNRCLIVLWPGNRLQGALEFAEFGHPEYRRYEDSSDYIVVDMGR